MVCMTKLESILEQAKRLSPPELEELMKALSSFLFDGSGEDDAAVGRRGLIALTESTKDEDWSMYYPDELRNGAKRP